MTTMKTTRTISPVVLSPEIDEWVITEDHKALGRVIANGTAEHPFVIWLNRAGATPIELAAVADLSDVPQVFDVLRDNRFGNCWLG